MQRPPFLPLLCVLLASIAASGCATTPRLDSNFGRSVGLLRAQQVINPQAGLNRDPVAGLDGKSAAAAYQAYEKTFSAPVPQSGAMTISLGRQ
ncbi:pilus assembly protein [Janthinobacterium sp. FW305-129]|uniref:pilus assembly protein n=1 Tax=Janthinobacterium sp. FW305-129 TaxID=2775054 RepID=UPI001E5CF3D6|nr:pilus assembly protein [Janthinobacterium sp. FW305-129]MCC7600345.1 pilus assembly protein [Janthinobacterium sp. FW305-129]